MAQTTNLNVSPYFDDFNADDNYHKILFKPGLPVQARELTGLQSILQNQISKFGQHIFKEGSKVIPGNTTYNSNFACVEINNEYLGVTVKSYIDQLLNRKIVGLTSGVAATIVKILDSTDSIRDNLTLYIRYDSSSLSNDDSVFLDGELLAANVDIVSGPENSTFIPSGESFAGTISANATSTASSFSISEGVYFIRGTFVNVPTQTILLDQYSNTPTGRIGLRVLEETINSDEDPSLTDNSKGFNNFAAPGADRFKISCSLFFKSLDDLNDDDFVELASVRGGELRSKPTTSEYNIINDELARRTFSESGDYTVKPFSVSVRESLNDNIGNNGVYTDGQTTEGGSIASDDLALFQVSAGKAFVKGYEIETTSSIFLDVEKPRTTKTLEGQRINYNTGGTLRLNNQTGSPEVGVGNTFIVSLRDQRSNGLPGAANISGEEIGVARVYDFALESGSYSATNSNVNEYDISLYDVQTFSKITLNQAITQATPAFIKGKFSGATGFLRSSASNTTSLTLYEKSGELVPNEPIIINGEENSRIAIAVTSFGMADVKSLYAGPDLGNVGSAKSFVSDVVQADQFIFGSANMTSATGSGSVSISTITSGNDLFPGKLKVGNILKFGGLGNNLKSLVRITEVNASDVVVTGVTTVTGVTEGALYKSTAGTSLEVSDLTLVTTPFEKSFDNSLFTVMPKEYISDVDISSATLNIRKTFDVTIGHSNNQLTSAITAGTNETFLPFDEERYSLIRKDGTQEILTSDKFTFTSGNAILQINNIGADLSSNQDATLVATLAKTSPTAKIKRKERVNSQLIDKSSQTGSGTGGITLNDGLTSGNYPFGTRVQDEKISLNTPDVLDILGIFESLSTDDPSAPKMILSSIDSPRGKTSDLIIGEEIRGVSSGAVAVYAETLSDSQISFLLLSDVDFKEGESVSFKESNIQAIINTLDNPSKDITENYKFSTGQKSTIYDFGFIKRLSGKNAPTRKLKVYFSNGYFESTDEGDITVKNSYNDFNYSDVQYVNGIRNTDLIDIRPRVSNYSVSESDRSPLEFFGRSFDGSGNSAANVLASDESIILDYSFFLGRIDRIYLSKNGLFTVSKGAPSEDPEKPEIIDNALEIAEIKLPPYLFDVSKASLSFLKHKRYRMQDIRKLEERIKNLEYYTTLSLLETETSNLFVSDENGLNKFKSGFFVDNFTSLLPQETFIPIKNSVDLTQKELRASHYCNSIDLQVGPVEGQNTIFNGADPEGTNIRKTGKMITLDYDENIWLGQPFATRSESVTPFIVNFWQASMELIPATDTWIETTRIEPLIIERDGNFAETVQMAEFASGGFDPQTGLTNTIWGGWQTTWTGTEQIIGPERRMGSAQLARERGDVNWRNRRSRNILGVRDIENFALADQTRQGRQLLITETFEQQSNGDRTVSSEVIPIMRSRNVTFDGTGFLPQTRLYAFFDGVNVTSYCVPKLIEISMKSGVFQVGETVTGEIFSANSADPASIRFKVAVSNHKHGPFNAPTRIYAINPYSSQTAVTQIESYSGSPGIVQVAGGGGSASVIPSSYSSTSTTLNVDLDSLAEQPQGDFFGRIETGMILKGGTSGAEAEVTNLRLISDYASTALGSFFIPNPNISSNPTFQSGRRTFTLIDNDQNNTIRAKTIAQEVYESTGRIETVQENIISLRNARVQSINFSEDRRTREFVGFTTDIRVVGRTPRGGGGDPLAQSFFVEDSSGVYATSVEVFFETVDRGNVPVQLDIRTVELGVPSQKVLPFSQINLNPDQITTSSDGSVPTKFTFKSPVYLSPATEYAIVLLSGSSEYRVFISRIGESDLITDEYVSNQPTLGSLFKSQNASSWEPSQWEDLKFFIYAAEFVPSGSVQVYNPILSEGNAQIPKLLTNSLNVTANKIRVGISSAFGAGLHPQIGNTISQQGSNATGNLVSTAGIATGNLTVSKAGIGYTPASGNRGLIGIALSTITGSGRNATANVHFDGGVAVAATISNGGEGYSVGDVLGISTNLGINARLTVASIGSTSELILDNVQGGFLTGAGTTLMYAASTVGITSAVTGNGGEIGAFIPASGITTVSDGLHIIVNHKNHGMHHQNNRVTISGVESDVPITKLTAPYNNDSTANISVASTSEFTTFENVGVAATNPGYLKIKNEIIRYTGFSGDTLTGITRQQDSTLAQNYVTGDLVSKYEFGGVSLRRINLTHNFANVTDSNPITFDSYKIKLDMGANGIGRTSSESYPLLKLKETKSGGGAIIHATQNMPFEVITPMIQNTTVSGTSLSADIKTVSGTSLNTGSGQGSDTPFVVQPTEAIGINRINYLNSPRIIASRVNETNNSSLTVLPGDRSFNMTLNLSTEDSRVSPTIDMERISAIITSNRIDKLVSDFTTDNRVATLDDDPSGFQYISKENVLETSATSLKIILDAHINEYTDIRAFYAISENQGSEPTFVPFPGFNNLNEQGQIISIDKSDGRTDEFTPPSEASGFISRDLEYKELTFSVNDLPSFKSFRVKLVLTSTNQAYVPRVSDLKVIALA